MTTPLVKGFHSPTQDSQVVFRQILKAMSEPGTIVELHSAEAIENLYPSSFATCLSLMDQQTPLWLSPHFDSQKIKHNLHFHSGVTLTDQITDASFALLKSDELESLNDVAASFTSDNEKGFSQGSSEYPETGCTVLVQVKKIHSQQADATKLKLTGPGIESEKQVSLSTLPANFLSYLTNNSGVHHSAFPLGLDFIFLDQHQVFCLPRTTLVEVI
ncbi:phosphonate C-P lyase system protein PhnH [Marinomonas sp. C2222]|uniref:Phosphonate C-P lyase system protein PhnH n=1 Tax=Marinomonas sargassi TaxID=2984494 RepID=A0ABT2YPP6_9GAMM|nr:phosphonate C-P lyase system protein PhnH [Marinomonas sargassi]MCV2401821.1 phosphonate C-P lyase system protein PhnH [Marinomonas sargassi]